MTKPRALPTPKQVEGLEDDPQYKAAKETHKVFISNLMKGHTATDAYKIAFPTASHKKAGQRGYELKNRYADLMERHKPIDSVVIERVANKTLENLMLMAFADVGAIMGADGKPLPLTQIPKELRMAITEVEIEGDKVKYKWGGKVKGLEMLSKIARIEPQEPTVQINLQNEEERDNKLYEILVKAKARIEGEDK